ncbi:Glycine reductase complex component B subunit gamma, partial [Frankliniella fusca]
MVHKATPLPKNQNNTTISNDNNEIEVEGEFSEEDETCAMLLQRDESRTERATFSATEVCRELDKFYRETPMVKDRMKPVLEWWEEHKYVWPALYEIALILHSIPATQNINVHMHAQVADETVKADRLPVVVSGKDIEKLLGVPELKHGSGECIASAVVSLLKEWELDEKVVGMAFDTTSTNSGRWGGACALIQQKLGKELLELACRHHVLERLLRAVFDAVIGSSKTRELLSVDTLKMQWKEIDQ